MVTSRNETEYKSVFMGTPEKCMTRPTTIESTESGTQCTSLSPKTNRRRKRRRKHDDNDDNNNTTKMQSKSSPDFVVGVVHEHMAAVGTVDRSQDGCQRRDPSLRI